MFDLQLGVPTIIYNENKVKISVDIIICQEKRISVWYEVDSIYQEYLYTDRVDPFLVAILPYCMKEGYDIYVSEKTGVSVDLLYQIKKIMLPAITSAKVYDFQMIDIKAVPIYKSLKKGEGIATGISRGMDSFYTILNNIEGLFPLTSLTLFNVQSFGEFGGEVAREYFYGEVEEAKKICSDLNREYNKNLNLVTVDSNIQDIFPIEIFSSGSYRDAGAILLLKQMFKLYYFAADVRLEDFSLGNGIRRENPWIFYCLSTENYRIQLFGAEATRIDKAAYISKHSITYENLRVCLQPLIYGDKGIKYQSHINCTYDCDKCRYTVMELAAVGELEKYRNVFDLNLVKKKYKDILAESVVKKNLLQPHWGVIYKAFRQKGEIDDLFEQQVIEKQEGSAIDPESHNEQILKLIDCFLQRIQIRPSIMEQLTTAGYQRVAIYGMGRLGKLLYCELKDIVIYGIDRNPSMTYGNILLKRLDEKFPPVDLILITTIYDNKLIIEFLQEKITCRIMTLDELLSLD